MQTLANQNKPHRRRRHQHKKRHSQPRASDSPPDRCAQYTHTCPKTYDFAKSESQIMHHYSIFFFIRNLCKKEENIYIFGAYN